jgi:hypothetical protein
MIKKLLVMVALLVPSLGYAANTSVDLSAPKNPATPASGIACDQGPAAGSIPAPAQAAGFTKCALNADFTTSSTDSNGIKYSDVTTWISECGAPTRTYNFHVVWWYNVTDVNPCPSGNGNVSIVSDPLGGGFNVFHMQYTLADQTRFINACNTNCSGYQYDNLLLEWPTLAQNSPGLPYEMYIENSVYIPTTTLNSGVSGHQPGLAPNSTDVSSAYVTHKPHLAIDQFEINAAGFDSGQTSWTWNSGFGVLDASDTNVFSSGINGSAFNFSSGYNVIGQLITSDEARKVSICTFINGVSQGCNNNDLVASNVAQCGGGGYACYFNQNSVVLVDFLPIAVTCFPWTYNLPGGAQPCIHNNIDFYYKSIRVFTCANYKTTQCPGPLITSDNATLRRYATDYTPEGLIRRAVSWLVSKTS